MARLALNKINVDRDILEDEQSVKTVDRWIFYMLVVAIGVIPLIIGMHTSLFVSPLISGTGITQTAYQSDMFTYYKFIVLVTVTIISLVLFLYKLLFLNYQLKKDKVTFSIYAFIFFLLMSVIFAEYKTIALWGMYNRHDGAITYICFSILMFIAINIMYPKKALNIITYALYPFVWINVVIALLTFYGKNILLIDIVQKILTIMDKSGAGFIEGSVVSGTLNQWNYMSGISAILVMIFLALSIFQKNLKFRILNLFTAVAAFATLLVSISSSGFLAFVVMSVIMLIALLLKGPKVKGIIVFLVFLCFVSVPLSMFSERDPRVWDNSMGMFVKQNPFKEVEGASSLLNNRAYAADSEFELPTLPERGTSAGSGRVYIWSTMLELIQDKPFVGYGLDTMLFHFPQNELDKRADFLDETVLVDKPHNMYLGILWGTGIFGFLVFVATLLIFTATILKGVYRKISSTNPYFIALSMGFGAFLIQALFNDSVIGLTIAPLLIGAILYTVQKNEQPVEEIS
ncbi:O-antigen ligase family protein [Psychrobacillus sp. PGGUH221]|uniref:O-antigen ligase family protein n=1 Tax=Psychrobacillus sp. PGGUH221 TaxID=3020058 RepID=UPI0035C69E12